MKDAHITKYILLNQAKNNIKVKQLIRVWQVSIHMRKRHRLVINREYW